MLLSCILACEAVGLGSRGVSGEASALIGRWDLTFKTDTVSYPSWFEIVREGDTLRGRFQGRYGHATPLADITVETSRFRFRWPSQSDPVARPAEIEGRLVAPNAIEGTMIGSADRAPTPFIGARAPALDRPNVSRWDPPLDLLVDGLEGWAPRASEQPNGWSFEGGVLMNTPPSVDLVTRRSFDDFQLHLEVNVPPNGNSGIYLRGRYEIQVQDDYGKEPHSRRMGGVYGQVTPTALPAKPPGEWQSFDITLIGRIVTVMLNGTAIIRAKEIPGITGGALDSDEGAAGPIMLQGDHTAVRYRNIHLRAAVRAP